MTVQELGLGLKPLVRSFQAARRWLWLQRGIRTLAYSLSGATVFALLAATLTLFQAPQPLLSWLWTVAAACPVAGLVATLFMRPSEMEAIRIADFRLGLHQQLGTAYELLARGADGALVPWQISSASDLAEEAVLSRAFPLLPRRPLLVSFVLGLLTAGMLLLASMGVTIPNPLQAIKFPGASTPPAARTEKPLFANPASQSSNLRKSAALDSTRQILNQVQRQSQRGNLSQAAAASALQQANAELNKAAQESLLRQQALDTLATQLRSSAAGNDISQSLRQGDYQKAAQQIRDLGQQTDQLSAAAKQQLSQSLSTAASQSQSLQPLARAENRASQSVQKNDAQDGSYSMDRLASAVEDAGRQVVSQSELSQTWQQLQDLNKQLASGQGADSSQQTTAPSAQSTDGSQEKASGGQQDQSADGGQPGKDFASTSDGTNVSKMPAGNGGPGNTPGGPPLGAENPALGSNGNSLELPGQIGNKFSDQSDNSGNAPSVMREGDATSFGGQGQAAGDSSSVPAENVFVPSDRTSIVRDYFSSSKGAGSQ